MGERGRGIEHKRTDTYDHRTTKRTRCLCERLAFVIVWQKECLSLSRTYLLRARERRKRQREQRGEVGERGGEREGDKEREGRRELREEGGGREGGR